MQKSLCDRLKAPAERVGVGLYIMAKTLALSLMILCGLWHANAVWAEATDTPQASPIDKAGATPEFRKLSNDELLQQSESLWRASLENFRSEMRGLATSELLLRQAQMASDAFHLPEDMGAQAVRGEQETLETAKIQAD